jgi:hypothetical protein
MQLDRSVNTEGRSSLYGFMCQTETLFKVILASGVEHCRHLRDFDSDDSRRQSISWVLFCCGWRSV